MKTTTIILTILLSLNFSAKSNILFDYSELTENQITQFEEKIENLKSKNPFFEIIIDELENRNCIIKIVIDSTKTLAAFQPGKDKFSGTIYFENLEIIDDEYSILEEFFHCFQHNFYNGLMLTRNENNEIPGGSNIEYEAKLMRAIILLSNGSMISETPSQKGLLDFTLSILDEKGDFSLNELSEKQFEDYITLVKYFQSHWKTRNINENLDNFYDDPVIETIKPDATFYILGVYRNK